jgi:hypothetical protein
MKEINLHLESDTHRIFVFNKSNTEFERVRELCLQDKDNILRDNYLPENLIIEDHDVFHITYLKDSNDPLFFSGIYNNGRYPESVARITNRLYVFPDVRDGGPSIRLTAGYRFGTKYLMENNPVHRDLYFYSMQNRSGDLQERKPWWSRLSKFWIKMAEPDVWVDPHCLVQVVDGDSDDCYQNICYMESENYKFTDWSPKTRPYSK